MRSSIAALLALTLSSCSGCDPEVSQIIVRIEAEPGVVAMTRSLEVEIDGGPNRSTFTDADTVTFDGNTFPRTIALAPKGDDPSRFYRVVARARRERVDNPLASTFAQAALIGTYIRGETRVVVLRIEDSCIDAGCEELEHCADARCQDPPLVTPEPLDGGVGDMSMPDMGPRRCATDADCDDDIDCTVDACTTGTCTNEPDDGACPAPANQCQRAVCTPGVGCDEAPRSGPCDNRMYCDGEDTCMGGVCNGAGDPCIGMTECNEELDVCTGCADETDCTNGRVCSGGSCICTTGSTEACDLPGDEDCDGLSNCADFDCDGAPCGMNGRVCTEGICACPDSAPERFCGNGVDDDCDGLVDCEDDDCGGRTCEPMRVCMGDSCEEDVFEICDNGIDDDSDGATDCADTPECDTAPCVTDGGTGFCAGGFCEPDCVPEGSENDEGSCGDGVDNDCNGMMDCGDPSCFGTCVCGACDDAGGDACVYEREEDTEGACDDGRDNNCDGDVDCADIGCAFACVCGFCDDGGTDGCVYEAEEDTEARCDDGIDNNCDGDVDCADFGCAFSCVCGFCDDGGMSVGLDPI